MSNATHLQRVAILFSGGPAPAANAVITAAASAFRRAGTEVVGIMHGYSALQHYDAENRPLVADEEYFVFKDKDLQGLRNTRGIIIGTSRANPGKKVRGPADLDDPARIEPLMRAYQGLVALGVQALVSIGGDDTLKTANLLYEVQKRLPEEAPRVRIAHVPKTIDNDYRGIDFTFGFFTAVDVMARELLNLRADAKSTKSYFVVETMGRKAGWLSYGVAVAGEAHMVIAVEDVVGELALQEDVKDPITGAIRKVTKLDVYALADRIVNLIEARESHGKHYGTIVLAEGLAEMLPSSFTHEVGRDEHGHISLGKLDIGKLLAQIAAERYEQRTGKTKKLTGVQLGYESRCSEPHAFDVMLGCQLGLGAYRVIAEKGLDGQMVSVAGQLELRHVPFSQLVNPKTLMTEVRFIDRESDFHRLAHSMETRLPHR